jgi:serine/threonine protein kinase/Flp pilus assembly protein TadD
MIGKTISHYRIVEEIGRGGMGTVYKAEDIRLKRTVALKFLPPELTRDPEAKSRFIREAQAASSLEHPNICTIHEIGETRDGQLFIVMSFYEGHTLRDKIKEKRCPKEEIVEVALQIAEGLCKAHENGIVHRDIKPENIFLTNDGYIKILDFGLAKLTGQAQVTRDISTLGTVAYMSPEQIKGEAADQRSDIWGLGVVLYEMCAGELPFKGDYEQAIIYSILNEESQPPASLSTSSMGILYQVISKCLKKDKDERYNDLSELIKDLKKHELLTNKTDTGFWKPTFSHVKLKHTAIAMVLMVIIIVVMLMHLNVSNITTWLMPGSHPARKHLAVLPFTSFSQKPGDKAFCDGLVETLTSKLGQLEYYQKAIWIVPASEIRTHEVSSPSAARKKFKNVEVAVTGSIQFSGDEMRLAMNLIDTKSLRQLTSCVKTYEYASLFKLQDDIVIELVNLLNEEFEPHLQSIINAGGTEVSRAYEQYLKGRGFIYHYQNPGKIDSAIILFHEALSYDSNYALAYAGLGEAYWRKYNASKNNQWVDSARYYCTRSLHKNDRLAPVHVTLGMLKSGTGLYEEAVQHFNLALDLDPVNSDAYRSLASTYNKLGEVELAESTYKKAIELKPDYWSNFNSLGVFYYQRGKYSEAIEQFKRVVFLTPENIKGMNNLGAIYFFVENYEEAINTYEKSLEIQENYIAYSNLGTLYYFKADYIKSTTMFEKALAISDTDFRLLGNLGSSYSMLTDQQEKCREAYEKAISLAEDALLINPNDLNVLANLANYHASIGNESEALSFARRVVDQKPNSLDIMYRLCEVYEDLGDREKALYWIKKCIEKGYSIKLIEQTPGLKMLYHDVRFKKFLDSLETTG